MGRSRSSGAAGATLAAGSDSPCPSSLHRSGRKTKLHPLHRAAEAGLVRAVAALLEAGHAVDARMPCGHTPLCLAVVRGDVGMVRTLLDAGANVNARTEEDMTPLLLAAEKGTPAVMGQLLRADPPPNITAVNERTHTALMLAAWCNTPGVVAKLLEAGAAADTGMNCGWTALMLAAQERRLAVVRVLFSKKACANTVAADGWTPLLLAISAHVASEAVVRLLLGAGADSAGPGARVAPLYLAAEAGATATVTLLLEATPPAPLEATAADGSTASLVAAQNGHAPALRALLNAGARRYARPTMATRDSTWRSCVTISMRCRPFSPPRR